MKYTLRYTGEFKRSLKRCLKRGYNDQLLTDVLHVALAHGKLVKMVSNIQKCDLEHGNNEN